MKKSTLLHLRIPFSFFLVPVFMLAVAVSEHVDYRNFFLSFFILHFLVYPASNGYNSYFDKDEGSIGGLKTPPKVTKELYWTSLIFDVIGLLLSIFISLEFVLMIFLYGLISKAYSHPIFRLKKRPIIGWLVAGIFQGYYIFNLSYGAITNNTFVHFFDWETQIPGVLSSLLLFGSYPMTQIYQHEEDFRRGDITLSIKLGILGTFHFTSIISLLACIGFLYYFMVFHSISDVIIFSICMIPILTYFVMWYWRVRKDRTQANFVSSMRFNMICSIMFNIFFIYLWLI